MAGTQMSFDVFMDHMGACETRASGKIYLAVDLTWWGLLISTVRKPSGIQHTVTMPCTQRLL